MIHPISQNTNIVSSNNLTPVEIPHFSGKARAAKQTGDSFTKSKKTKLENNPGADIKKAAGKAEKSEAKAAKEDELKENATVIAEAATKGAKEGLCVIADITKKGIEFTGAFIKSVMSDSKDIIRDKGFKTINAINNII